ncbi:LexA family transcriptional regulator [Methylobacterium organophilum]|uniref:LexA family protein n=1 Tax=Methylobacterium organophilum TaxID=410 RepID=UPI001F1321FA|nr:XRE family transcriptional regulator [Methylobacterium organophilum]UMY19095.1 LexA family transcriptional regulator [Methylobacterium organophilum]
MTEEADQAVLARIQSRLLALGLSERGAAERSDLSASAIRNIREGKSQSPKLETIRKLAPTLETTPEWLAFGIEAAIPPPALIAPQLLPIVGEVAAGRWLEAQDIVDVAPFDPIPVTPDPRWPEEAQYGLVIRGTSLNRFAEDGDVLACVDAVAARYRRPRDNDLVIVEMRRDAGFLRQLTAKRYMRQGNHVELWPDSHDERWKKPIIIPLTENGLGAEIDDEDGRIEIRVKAMVTWLHRSMRRRG